MRPAQCILSCRQVCAYATTMLLEALAGIGWVSGIVTVEPLLLVQLLVRAAAERRSLDAIAQLAEQVPSVQTIRNALAKLLPTTTADLEPAVVTALQRRLPKSLRRRPRTMAIDLHTKPYYGDRRTPGTYRGQRKASTQVFFAYATLLVVRKGQSYTIGLVPVVNGEALVEIIDRLLQQAAQHGVRPRRLLLDRGFYAATVIDYLQQRSISFLMPMIRRGKAGKTKKDSTATAQFFVRGRKGWATYRWQARPRRQGRQGPRVPMRVTVCMVPPPVRVGKKSARRPWVFACEGLRHLEPCQVAELYRKRFRIETSYRQMNQGLAMTCSKNPVYRLLLVLIALVLRNLWVWLHATRLSVRTPAGHRILRLHLLRVRRLLHSLIRYLDHKLAIPNNIVIPTPAVSTA